MELRPQPAQIKFLASEADIAIFGGGAGGGKTYALLLEPLRHVFNPKFGAVIFRRTGVQVRQEGGLWDESETIYPYFAGKGLRQSMTWRFPSGSSVRFAHMEHEKDRFEYQGAQIPLICFDELTHFTDKMFWYMLGRNRSASGVAGYIRGTCNPDPDHFLRRLLDWWIDNDTGFPIAERAGKIRYFVRKGDDLVFADSKAELIQKFGPEVQPKSITFIPANVYDNKILLQKDPGYLANLLALPLVDREQLLKGNWNVRPIAGMFFRRHYFGIVDAVPATIRARCRFWDRAATEQRINPDADATVGLLLAKDDAGLCYVEDMTRLYESPAKVNAAMLACAQQDPPGTIIGFHQDPGSAGVYEASDTAKLLAGYNVRFRPATGDKQTRAKPVSAQAEAGNIKLLRGKWNESFLRELEGFPDSAHDDAVDGLSGAFELLTGARRILVA